MNTADRPGETGLTLAWLAERFHLELVGDGVCRVYGVNALAAAGPRELAFLANPKYRKQLATSAAAAVLMASGQPLPASGNALLSANPYADFARVAGLFATAHAVAPGIHASAVIDASATIDPTASIGPLCVVGAGSRVAAGVEVGPGSVIGIDCEVGADSRLVARVTLVERVRLGQRVLIHPGAVLGADGFGLAMDQGQWLKVPQLGGVKIGDDCEIGANTCIDRGTLGDTELEHDVRLDNQIQIGHNVHIGAHTAMAGCVAIAGSTRIGRHCLIGGGAGIIGHLQLADGVIIGAMSLVTHDLHMAGEYCSGTPIDNKRAWLRNAARFRELDALARRIKKES